MSRCMNARSTDLDGADLGRAARPEPRPPSANGSRTQRGGRRRERAQRFLEHVRALAARRHSSTREQKEFKKAYNAGRRELEHEFGKTMRYKSIRDLAGRRRRRRSCAT